MKRFTILIISVLLFVANTYAQVPEIKWTAVGIGGGGGQFTPAISPVDPNLMFVSCDMGGVYRTTDGGNFWNMINFRQLKSSTNGSTVFHPTDKNMIWDEMGSVLMKSTDGGVTWMEVWDISHRLNDMLIPARTNSFVMFLACGAGGLELGHLYKSLDGENFTVVENVEQAYLLAGNKNIMAAGYHSAWVSTDEGQNFVRLSNIPEMHLSIQGIGIYGDNIYIMDNEQAWKSTDMGNTWVTIAKAGDFNRGAFVFMRVVNDYVWITTDNSGKYQPTALLSKDAGNSFEPVFFCNDSWDDTRNLANGWLSLDFNCGWGGAAIGFNISPINPEIALWTDYGRTLMTTDAGKNWTAVYTEFSDIGERAAGKLWQSRGLEVTSSWDIFIPEDNNSFINVAYTDIGGAYSQDGGHSWRSNFDAGIPQNWHNTTYDFAYDADNKILWGAFSGRHDIPGGWAANDSKNTGLGGVAYSTDGGMHWTALNDNNLIEKPVTSIAVDFTSPVENRRLYAAVWSDGIWRSDDNGNTWQRISNGLDCGDGTNTDDGPNTHVVDVQVHPDGSVFALKTKYIREGYLIKNDAGLWKSTNHGDSWEFISANVPECPPNLIIDINGEHSWADAISFTLDEKDVNHIYVGAQNVNNGKVQGGLYETTDGGNSWKRIFQVYAAFRVTLSKYYKDRMYLATTEKGVMISEDGGKTWSEFKNFPFSNPTRVSEDPSDKNTIWVNTFGGGVWKGEFKIESGTNNQEQYSQISISPNPASEYIEINIPTLEMGLGGVSVFDVLGNVVVSLGDSRFRGNDIIVSDDGNVRLDISMLAPGVYFVRVGGQVLKFVKM